MSIKDKGDLVGAQKLNPGLNKPRPGSTNNTGKQGGGKNGGGKNGGGKGKNLTDEQKNDNALASLYTREGTNAGNALINKFLGEGALGRVSTEVQGAQGSQDRYRSLYESTLNRTPEQADVMGRMKGGLEGYTSQEYQAQREQMRRGLQSNYTTAASQLARSQAKGKVYGAAGAAQMQNLQRSTQNSKDTLEQDLMIKNIDERQRRLMEYGEYGRGLDSEEFDRRSSATKGLSDEEAALRTEELERQKINLGQSNAELAAQIGAFTGAGSTALAQKNTNQAQRIQKRALRQIGNM